MDLEPLWPYRTWRKGQIEIANAVYNSLAERKHLLVSYPTGAGKTAAVLTGALSAALEAGFKIVYLVRTRAQFQAPRRELQLLSNRINLNAVFLQNKRDLCLIRGASMLPYDEFINFCSDLVRNNLCPYYTAVSLPMPSPPVLDHETLISLARTLKKCPYEIARSAMRKAQVVVAAYNYIFDPAIQPNFMRDLGVELANVVLIVDEAHNLPYSLVNILSKDLSERTVRAARKELSRTLKRKELERDLYVFLALLRKLRQSMLDGESELEISVTDLREALPNVAELSKTIPLVERGLGRASVLRKLTAFLELLERKRSDYAITAKVEGGELKLTALNISPSRVSSFVFANIWSGILMSGTMPPRQYIVDMLGLDNWRVDEVRLPSPWAANVGVVVARGVTSRFVERGETTYGIMAEYITKLYAKLPSGVCLVVVPSYNMAKALRPYLRVKPLIVEREETRIDEVEEAARRYGKLMIVSVAWGKLVEGIELRRNGGSVVKLVILAGLPVPEPSVLNRKLAENLRHKLGNSDEAWRLVYMVPAAVRVAQAMGRSVRSENDRAAVAILDERALEPDVKQYLESFGYSIDLASSVEEALYKLNQYMV